MPPSLSCHTSSEACQQESCAICPSSLEAIRGRRDRGGGGAGGLGGGSPRRLGGCCTRAGRRLPRPAHRALGLRGRVPPGLASLAVCGLGRALARLLGGSGGRDGPVSLCSGLHRLEVLLVVLALDRRHRGGALGHNRHHRLGGSLSGSCARLGRSHARLRSGSASLSSVSGLLGAHLRLLQRVRLLLGSRELRGQVRHARLGVLGLLLHRRHGSSVVGSGHLQLLLGPLRLVSLRLGLLLRGRQCGRVGSSSALCLLLGSRQV
mmetsp:Transcript_20816/g.52922  ORF Transcript_20816/g.52922 Transcript_20816/m.52922 type:complete len:264 (-) Transcript_20816:1454-2245(-)